MLAETNFVYTYNQVREASFLPLRPRGVCWSLGLAERAGFRRKASGPLVETIKKRDTWAFSMRCFTIGGTTRRNSLILAG